MNAVIAGCIEFMMSLLNSWKSDVASSPGSVIPAQAGIQCRDLDSRLRGNDGE
jgi:hypothetical protein